MRFLFWLVLLVFSVHIGAQPRSAITGTPANLSAVQIPPPQLRRMIRDSGRIFAGTVTDIQRVQSGPAVPITRVTFRVEEAIRGVRKGQTVQISEWGGLWQAGERYHVGEHLLLFLYPESKIRLTSPVGGASGRFAINRDRRVNVKNINGGVRTPELKSMAAAIRRAAKEQQ